MSKENQQKNNTSPQESSVKKNTNSDVINESHNSTINKNNIRNISNSVNFKIPLFFISVLALGGLTWAIGSGIKNPITHGPTDGPTPPPTPPDVINKNDLIEGVWSSKLTQKLEDLEFGNIEDQEKIYPKLKNAELSINQRSRFGKRGFYNSRGKIIALLDYDFEGELTNITIELIFNLGGKWLIEDDEIFTEKVKTKLLVTKVLKNGIEQNEVSRNFFEERVKKIILDELASSEKIISLTSSKMHTKSDGVDIFYKKLQEDENKLTLR